MFRDQNNHPAHIHRITRSWVEGTGTGTATNDGVSYQRYDETYNWSTYGGDYAATALDTVTIYKSGAYGWKKFNVTSSIADMVDGTIDNYGWLLKFSSDVGSPRVDGDALFYSSDHTTDTSKRPYLEISFRVDPLVVFAYDEMGRPDTTSYATGVKEINQYDSDRGWLERRDYKEGSTNYYYFNSTGSTDFDDVGNLKKVVYKYKDQSTENMEYSYDNLYRITKYKYGGSVQQSWGYDDNGNLTSVTGKTMTYGGNNNRLTSDGSRAMVYDGACYLTSLGGTTLTWDCLGNLTAHGSDTYSDDADNLRIKKTESSTTTYYIRNGLQELAEYGTGNELLAEYIYGNGRKRVKVDPERGYLWYFTGHLKSTRLITGNDTSDVEKTAP